jgi:Fungal specific transcription factor domain
MDYIVQEGAFVFPQPSVCEALLQAYFEWFHPCFPIIDREEFSTLYTSKALSPLLLQATLFVATSHCSVQRLKTIGLRDLGQAKFNFYNRAKLLYDTDWEANKLTRLQALFLMSFWRDGPSGEKDTRHWLGAAISLAQTKGLHRSYVSLGSLLLLRLNHFRTRFFNAQSRQMKLQKRIWWSLYVRCLSMYKVYFSDI